MAVFGPQLIYTVIMFVMLSKLGKYYSIGRYIMCTKLTRFLSPNSEDIKKSVRNFYKSTKKDKKLNHLFEISKEKEEFNIPEGAEVEVACAPVQSTELFYIKYSDDLQSFIDISFIALFIYATTEVYVAFVQPTDEINLSVVWCGMALFYGLLNLTTIAYNYIWTEEGVLLYIFAAFSFMCSMIFQLADTKFLDFNLKSAFHNVTTNTLDLLHAHIVSLNRSNEVETDKAVSGGGGVSTEEYIFTQLKTYSTNDILFTCFIATISGFLGAILFFPSFRLARLHFLCLKSSGESKAMKIVYYLNFLMPLVVSLCWLKSGSTPRLIPSSNSTANQTEEEKATAQFLAAIVVETTENVVNATNASVLVQANQAVKNFIYNFILANNLKVYLIASVFTIRLVLYRKYAQAYLNTALDLASDLRQSATRITNTKYMSTISSIYQYYGVVASQYLIPLFCLLFLSLLLKTLGDYSWCGDSIICNDFVTATGAYISSFKGTYRSSPSLLKNFESSNFNMTRSHNVLNEIFSPYVLRSVIGYFTFWMSSIWFMISCFGLMYYQYIEKKY